MKKFSASDWAKLMLAGGVLWIMFSGGVSMMLRGSINPTPELLRVRELLFTLAGTALGGLLAHRQTTEERKDENKNNQ